LNIICLLKHSLVSSTIVISVLSTFSIALVFLNLYATLLFIVKSSLQCATEIINLIILIDAETADGDAGYDSSAVAMSRPSCGDLDMHGVRYCLTSHHNNPGHSGCSTSSASHRSASVGYLLHQSVLRRLTHSDTLDPSRNVAVPSVVFANASQS